MKKIFFAFIFIQLCGLVYSQDLLRYIDGESTQILSDWRLQQPKVNTSGYDRFSIAQNGNPVAPAKSEDSYRGKYSLKYEVDARNDIQRIEHKFTADVEDADALLFNNERFYGFAMKMDKFEDLTSSLIFWQAWQGAPSNPPVCLKFMTQKNSSGEYRVKLAIRNEDNFSGDESDGGSVYIPKGVWHTFQVYIKPRNESTDGEIKVWINGVPAMTYSGKIGYIKGGKIECEYDGLVCKWGIYQPNANTAHCLLFDEIKLGRTYDAVLPSPEIPTAQKLINTSPLYRIADKQLILNDDNSCATVKIMDISGKSVILQNNVSAISLQGLSKGIFIIQIYKNGILYSDKLIL